MDNKAAGVPFEEVSRSSEPPIRGASPVAYKLSMSSLDYRGPFLSRLLARDDVMTKPNIISQQACTSS